MKTHNKKFSRLCALLLAVTMLFSLWVPQAAAEENSISWTQVDNSAISAELPLQEVTEVEDVPMYRDTDVVRVSIFLETAPTIAKFEAQKIAENQVAMNYRDHLESQQKTMEKAISKAIGGKKLDVVWNLTLIANLISANVQYGEIAAIEKVPGVKSVVIENQYLPAVVDTELPIDPQMSTSTSMIGSSAAWNAGYTGAGTRIAVIDTGTDTDHQSFDDKAFEYSLSKQAEKANKTVESYHLLEMKEIEDVLDKLNVHKIDPSVTAEDLYRTSKLPFGYNYIDRSLEITHDKDTASEHGSHVAGIAAANTYIPDGHGGYSNALDAVKVQGVAPDAQIITMKVFGRTSPSDSDYFAAIEDAIYLNCDSVNLSLGSTVPGRASHSSPEIQKILDDMTKSGVVVVIAAGNAGSWVENAVSGPYLYSDDVNMDMVGAPGSFTDVLTVASIDNIGLTGEYYTVGDEVVVYQQVNRGDTYAFDALSTLAGEHDYILIDGIGTNEEFAAVADQLSGNIAVCSRGTTSFYEKAEAAVANGAIATIVYNNVPGAFGMDLTGYTKTAPCVSITQADGSMMKSAATEQITDRDGKVLGYRGTLTVETGMNSAIVPNDYNTMSSFSSWGTTSALELKPEITAPGGNIYSVDGSKTDGKSYENMSGTSMATPQVSGMMALVAQYIRENKLTEKTELTPRQLAQSLLMSTAIPQMENLGNGKDGYYSLLRQGAGLANVGKAMAADSYILMGEDATKSYADGKVKAELGDDPERTGSYEFSFSIHNLTNEEKTYALSADFFTQAVFTDPDTGWDYMHTGTTRLEADVRFDNNGSVTVQPNGEAKVKVTVTLTDGQKAVLNKDYPAGAYIQGFVYARSAATDEGVAGTEHSIAVLGFYGSWTDPSMYDVGTQAEFAVGAEKRTPYLGNKTVNSLTIAYANKAYGTAYFGGNPLQPDESYMPERNSINSVNGDRLGQLTFTPIRTAGAARAVVKNLTTNKELWKDEDGAIDAAFYYAQAGAWQYTTTKSNLNFAPHDASEGDELALILTLAPEYYVDSENGVAWDALGAGASMKFPMVVDNTAPELTDVFLGLMGNSVIVTAKDNRYVSGVALYNSAGTKQLAMTGAKQEIEPGEEAQYTLDMSSVSGSKFLLQIFDYAMNVTTFELNLKANGGEQQLPDMLAFKLAKKAWTALDPADGYNATGASITSEHVYLAAAFADGVVFASTDRGELYVLEQADPAQELHVANMGMVFTDMAYDKSTETLYGVSENRLVRIDKMNGSVEVIGEIPFQTNTLASDGNGTFYSAVSGSGIEVANRGFVYAYTLGTLQGTQDLRYDFDGDGIVSTKDAQAILDFALEKRTAIENIENADFDGNHKLTSRDAYLFMERFGSGSFENTPRQVSSRNRNNVKALAWNPNNGYLYGTMFDIANQSLHGYLYEINPEAGTEKARKDFRAELTSLVILEKTTGGVWANPTNQVSGIQMSDTSMTLLQKTSGELYALVQPWTATNRNVVWSSSDPEIVEVDERGVVTAVKAGQAIITAASVLDPTVKATCTVTVEPLKLVIKGALQDADSNPMLFTWDVENDKTWTAGLPLEQELVSIAYDAVSESLYLQDDELMYQVDLATGKTVASSETSCAFGIAMSDMAALDLFNTKEQPGMMAVALSYLLGPCAPMDNTFNDGWPMEDYLYAYTGAEKFVALASLGTAKHPQTEVPCDQLCALDDAGYLWFILYDGTSHLTVNRLIPTDLDLTYPTYNGCQYCSMVSGNDGSLYLSYFTGDTNVLYRLAWDEEQSVYASMELGNVGDGVWPATLYAVETDRPSTQNCKTDAGILVAPLAIPSETINLSQLRPQSRVDAAQGTVTLTLTAKNAAGAVASNNGILSVIYDALAMQLESVKVFGDCIAKQEAPGVLTLGYVSLEGIPADAPVAQLTFSVRNNRAAESYVTVLHREVNDENPTVTEQVPVSLTETSPLPFTDVKEAAWYYDAVNYVYQNSLMNGMTKTTFEPQTKMSRAMLVTVLWRNAGEPQEGMNIFSDVADGRYYTDAVAWAAANRIVKGVGEGKFDPDGNVTREQMVAILYRYANTLGIDTGKRADLSRYSDSGKVSNYADEALRWAVAEEIIQGTRLGGSTEIVLSPQGNATRAEVATILMRFIENVLE